MRRRFQILLLLALLAALAAAPARAAGPADLTGMSLESLLDVTVSGASRYEQRASEAPTYASVVTAEEIRKYGYRTLADLLRSLPGIFVTNDRNYSYVGIRGFQPAGDYNSRVLLLVDGHRVNNSIYDQAPIGNDFPVDIDLVERVEVVRGPSSSLYGSNAFFGVINVITKRAYDIDGAEISGSAGSWRTYKGRATAAKDYIMNGPAILVSGTAADSRGQDLYFPEYDDPATNNGVAEGDDRERYDSLFAKVSWGDFTLEGARGSRTKRLPTASFGTVFDADGTYTGDRTGFLDLRYEKDVDSGLNLMARAYYDEYYYWADYIFNYAPGDPDVINKDYAKASSFGAELKAVKTVRDRHRLTAGVEFRNDYRKDQQNYDLGFPPPFVDSHQSSKEWGAYLQDEFRIHPKLILNAGVRYDHYSTFGGTTNPRLGLIWTPREKTAVKLLYGRAFRTPTSYELYYGDYLTTKPNPDLRPETIRSIEAVLEQRMEGLGGSWKATVSAFHNRIDDLITMQPDPSDGLDHFGNNESIETNGLELELEGRLPGGIQGRASYAWQRAEYRHGGGTFPNSPKDMAKLNLSFPLLPGRLFLSPEAQYIGPRKTLPGKAQESVGGYTVANATLLARKLPWGLELSASVYNLFDKRYADPADTEHLQDSIPQDGRSYRIQATCRF